MTLDDATDFIENLFSHAWLATRKEGAWVQCWVYLPAFKNYRFKTKAFIRETDKKVASDEWRIKLSSHPRLTREWVDVLPVLAFHHQSIARTLLPAIVFEHMRCASFKQGESAAEFWASLAHSNPPEGDRDPLNPFDWCVALNPDLTVDDLKWNLSTPPKSIHALQDYVNEWQQRRSD